MRSHSDPACPDCGGSGWVCYDDHYDDRCACSWWTDDPPPPPAEGFPQEEDLLGAAIGAGRLLRSIDGGLVVDSQVKEWIRGLDMESISIIGGAAESLLAENLEVLHRYCMQDSLAAEYLARELEAGTASATLTDEEDDVETAFLEAKRAQDSDAPDRTLEAGWASKLVCSRDDSESLLYLLGAAALELTSEAVAVYERGAMDLARQVDRVAEAIPYFIADALRPVKQMEEWPWLERIAPIGEGCWWLNILHRWSYKGLSV